jgi:beta-glucosidase
LPLSAKFILNEAKAKPDLSLKNIRTLPAFPKVGEEVVFMASLINNGTAATSSGDAHIIHFYLDGQEVATNNSKSEVIPIGGMIMACAKGTKKGNWKASKGEFSIRASVEVSKSNDLNNYNNSIEAELIVPNGKVIPAEIVKILNIEP